MNIFPFWEWIKSYKKENLRGDLSGGAIVAIMLVPQGMAYAMLAGLPPVIGLYASTIPLIVYALFGSSRHLAVGPVAMVSLLVYVACSPLAEPGSADYIRYALLLAFMVGILQLALGLFRMGFIINYVSHAAISGFTSAAAIVIFLSQMRHILGIHLSGSHSTLSLITEIIRRIGETNLIALSIGIISIVILLLFKKRLPRFPAPLLVVFFGVLCSYLFRLDQSGVGVVGAVPRGAPGFSAPAFEKNAVFSLFPAALTLVFVGFLESIAVAELIASREKYKIFPNREFVALGMANIAASLFSGYPVTGGFSRTAVNYDAGTKTRFASIITAFLIILSLLFLTPFFYYLPNAVLAAIIIVAVLGLIKAREAVRLLRVKTTDGLTLLLTFILVLVLGVEKGVIAGVIFSLLIFIWRSSHPHLAELGLLEKQGVFRNIRRYPEAKTVPGVLILRIDASLYFANMGFIEDFLRRQIEDHANLEWIVFDMEGVNDIDGVAVSILEEIMEQYRERGIGFLFASMKGPGRDLIERAGWREKYGDSFQFFSIQYALSFISSSRARLDSVQKANI